MARKTNSTSSTRKPAARKPAATTTPEAKPEAVQLQPLLLAALKDAGVKVKVRTAPQGNYCSLLVGETNVAYVDKQTSKGLKVTVAAQPGDVKAAKGFTASGRSGRFGAQLMVTKEAEVAQAAAGVKLAAEKLAAEAATKADAAKAKKAAAKKAAAKAEPKPEAPAEAQVADVDALLLGSEEAPVA